MQTSEDGVIDDALILTTTSALYVLLILLFILKTEQQQNLAGLPIRDTDSVTKETKFNNSKFQIELKRNLRKTKKSNKYM